LASDYPEFQRVAEHRGTSAQNIALAWLMAQGPHCIPIPAFTRMETADRAAAAAHLQLSAEELAILSATQPRSSGVDDEF